MDEVQVIQMNKTHHGWMKMLLHLQNSTPSSFKLIFPDVASARAGSHRMSSNVAKYPTWFRMVVLQRGTSVYIIKTDNMQKVVIR